MRTAITISVLIIGAFGAGAFLVEASDPGGIGDWPMWGGTPDRNMVSNQHVVTSWDVKTGKNVKWVAAAGIAELRESGGGGRAGVRRDQ